MNLQIIDIEEILEPLPKRETDKRTFWEWIKTLKRSMNSWRLIHPEREIRYSVEKNAIVLMKKVMYE